MTARELVATCEREEHWQLYVNEYVDTFRRESSDARRALMAESPEREGPYTGLVAAVLSFLCRELGETPPEWVTITGSPTPFFVLPARSAEMRLRLMLESPSAFRVRNVFVPENYLSRA